MDCHSICDSPITQYKMDYGIGVAARYCLVAWAKRLALCIALDRSRDEVAITVPSKAIFRLRVHTYERTMVQQPGHNSSCCC